MENQNSRILAFEPDGDIRLRCTLNLNELYREASLKIDFKDRFFKFLLSHADTKDVFSLDEDVLRYSSEQLIPAKTDDRPALLLVLGNPATQSVKNGMFFSYEGDGKEHRFWKDILRPAEISCGRVLEGTCIEELNAARRNQILDLTFSDRFRVGLCVFITMPSAPGGKWGGVAGVQRLLGREAFERLEKEESLRVIDCAKRFVGRQGRVIIFQKNAWNGLRSSQDPDYSLDRARAGKLNGTLRGTDISIFGVPPTRLPGPCSQALKDICRNPIC